MTHIHDAVAGLLGLSSALFAMIWYLVGGIFMLIFAVSALIGAFIVESNGLPPWLYRVLHRS